MNQVYVELADAGFLYKKASVARSRWRRDDVYKVVLARRGTTAFDIRDRRVVLRSGEFIAINPGDEHRQTAIDGEKVLVELSPRRVREAFKRITGRPDGEIRFRPEPRLDRRLMRWADAIVPELIAPDDGRDLILQHAAAQFAVFLIRSAPGDHLPDGAFRVAASGCEGIARAVEMMRSCHGEPLTLDRMAEAAGMSRYAFAHRFRQAAGCSPYAWLQRYRLSRLEEDLLRTTRSVTDAALEHGFASVASAHRLFRRVHGMTPAQWRNLRRDGVDTRDAGHQASEGDEQCRDADEARDL